MIRAVVLLAVFTLALAPGQAWAEHDDADVAQGLKAMRKGDYQAALDAFRRAHASRPTTRSHAEIGLAEQALHRWVDAETDLAGALTEPSDEWLETHRSLLDKALADVRSHLGMLAVESGPRGAAVEIDGEHRGVLPLPRPLCLLPGTAKVEITAPGRRPWRSEASITAGETTRLAPIFEPLDPPVPPVVIPAATAVEHPIQADQPPLTEPKSLGVIGWVALAVGSAAAGSGAYLLGSERHASASRRLLGIECLAVGSAVALSGGVIAVVTLWRNAASGQETTAGIAFAGRF